MTKEEMDVAKAIRDDIKDRRGLRQEWERIDSDIQQEILEKWAGIIEEGT